MEVHPPPHAAGEGQGGRVQRIPYVVLYRCVSTISMSGRCHGAGAAYGSCWVGQPAKSLVLYSYQDTLSVVGIIGTSSSTTAWICLMRSCCFAESVVLANWSKRASTAEFL